MTDEDDDSPADKIAWQHAYAAVDQVETLILKAGGEAMVPPVKAIFAQVIHQRIYDAMDDIIDVIFADDA